MYKSLRHALLLALLCGEKGVANAVLDGNSKHWTAQQGQQQRMAQ